MTNLGKVAIVVSTVGALGGAGAIANSYLSSPSNKTKERLINDGFDLNIDSDGWGIILIAYNKANITKTFKSKAEDETKEGLKQKCEEFWKKDTVTEEEYKKLRQWCVKEETISKILSRAKYQKLDTESTDVAVTKKWEEKSEQLKLKKDSFPTIGAQMTKTKEENGKALKEGCKGLNIDKLKTTGDDFNQNFESAKNWCFLKENDN